MHRNRQCVAFTRRTPNRINQMETACSASVLETISSARGHRGRKRTSAGQQSRAEEASRDEGERTGIVGWTGDLTAAVVSERQRFHHTPIPGIRTCDVTHQNKRNRSWEQPGGTQQQQAAATGQRHPPRAQQRARPRSWYGCADPHTPYWASLPISCIQARSLSLALSLSLSLSLTPSVMLRIRRG